MRNLLLLIFLIISTGLFSQTCTNLGQNPGTAFPVCGSATFKQTSVPICGVRNIPTPCTASGSIFQDKNPYWYKFTCFTTGTLAFEITPSNLSDDYDWQLFDVTNRDPADVYTDKSLFVACNWSGEPGKTGANASGSSLIVCEGIGKALFSKMPVLQEGHQYLLLVSHFTNSQSGYSLSFGGGTSSITDTTVSKITTAQASCDGKQISIHVNKKVQCKSLASNGSDFKISSAASKIQSAVGINCSNAFDLDSLVLILDNPLPPGTYTLTSQKGSDGNTLLDYCETPMEEGLNINFIINTVKPTPFDSISFVGCAPNELKLVFSQPILCSSVAPNGSDFKINASSGVTVTAANTDCNNGSTTLIRLQLSGPVFNQGKQTVTLQKGSDGNTIINECLQETQPGTEVSFQTKDTVTAAFNYKINMGCKTDTVTFNHKGGNAVNQWFWKFNERATSTQQNPVYFYTKFGAQQVQLIVTNGVCTDSVNVNFVLDNELKAFFAGPGLHCPQDLALFTDSSIGKIIKYNWDFGNGATSLIKNPPAQNYPGANRTQNYLVKLIVQNNYNCFDTLVKPIKVLNNCYIAVPTAFTPNGDGLNEYLYPTNAFKATNLLFRVYNRYGQLVFESRDFTSKWDGTIKGFAQPTGTYVWTLQYTHLDTGQPFSLKGTSVLIR